MTREISGRIRMVVSDDGTRCAAECPAYDGPYEADDKCWKEAPAGATGICTDPRFYGERVDDDSHPYIFDGLRCGACIAAEQAAASVPSCEGARGLDASEALREARVQGMREARQIVRVNMHIDAACADILRAIEAVRKGER